MSRIFVTGDVHGNVMGKTEGKARLGTKRWPEQKELGDNDFLFFLGDFGVIWEARPDRREEHQIKWLDKKNFVSLVIGGNHENWDRLRSLPIEKHFGVDLAVLGYRTFFVPNGTILNFDGETILCMGGAMSIDKSHRTEGVSWWAGEIPTQQEMNFAVRNLEALDWKVDYILSHTMPSNNIEMFNSKEGYHFSRIADPTARFLQFIADHVTYKGWYCGHFHKDEEYRDVINGTDVRVVMHNVLEINALSAK